MMVGSWMTFWNNIIRNVIFQDQQLKKLMKIPDGTNIVEFIDRYFIRAGYTSKTLKDEPVRIVYGDISGSDVGNPYVTKNQMSFDIYVKTQQLHNATKDRLMFRTQLIADRIAYLLTKDRYVENYRFWIAGDHDMGTSTIGYARYNITFNYMKHY